MSFTYKIAAFDLDGTLAASKQPLEKEMAQLLGKLASQVPIVIISGGSYFQFEQQFLPFWEKYVEQTSELNKNIILLPTCGTQTYFYDANSDSWGKVEEHSFSEPTRKKIIELFDEIIASGDFDIPEKHFGEYVEDRGTQITFSGLGQHASIEDKEKWDPTAAKRQKIKQELESKIPSIQANIGGTTSIDILPKNFDKAVALDLLLKRLNLQKKDVIFVGDAIFPGGNDYPVHAAGYTTEWVKSPQNTLELLKKWLS